MVLYKKRKKFDDVVKNLSRYPVLGQGKIGTVYKISEHSCLKVNKTPEINRKEARYYARYGDSHLFPELLARGRQYIVLELVKGVSLKDYLAQGNTLNEQVMTQLANMFLQGREIGLSLNPHARHIILGTGSYLKLVDLEDIVKFQAPKPFMLLHHLNYRGQKEVFTEFLKERYPVLYNEWFH